MLKEIEVEIAALKQRQGELDANLMKNGVFDGEVLAAQSSVDKKIRTLQSRREALLSGEDDSQSTAKLESKPKPQLRPPRRLTTKSARETAVEVSKQAEQTASSMPAETPLQDLLGIYGSTDSVAEIENDLLQFGEKAVPSGRPCEFSEKLYAGLIALAWHSKANVKAVALFLGNQRRLLERRVAALESRRQDPLSAIQLQHIEHKLTPLFRVDFANAVAPLIERIGALEQQRDAMKYCGVWESGKEYSPGNFVTDKGSVWHCNSTTRQRPDGSKDWTLAVKRGTDGKDSK